MKYGKRIRFGTAGKHLHLKADKKQNKIKADRYLDSIMGLESKDLAEPAVTRIRATDRSRARV